MLRILNLTLAAVTLLAAGALYQIKTDTRRLEAQVVARERHVERLDADIAHLTAERAYLTRPERLEPLARAQGLVPVTGDRIQRARPEAP
ncbi:MAG: hypothetical protein RL291_885 [Pseudomonadota bacterium]|jgi:cell division protein FtsL